jgi:hypothetical protein
VDCGGHPVPMWESASVFPRGIDFSWDARYTFARKSTGVHIGLLANVGHAGSVTM